MIEPVICIDCGWFGEFSDFLSEDGMPDTSYDCCPDCMSDDVYEFDGLGNLNQLLHGKNEETRRKVLDRVIRERVMERFLTT